MRGGAVDKRTRGGSGGGGGGDKRQRNKQLVQVKWGDKDGRVRQHMMRGKDDWREMHVNKVEGLLMGNNCGNIR